MYLKKIRKSSKYTCNFIHFAALIKNVHETCGLRHGGLICSFLPRTLAIKGHGPFRLAQRVNNADNSALHSVVPEIALVILVMLRKKIF